MTVGQQPPREDTPHPEDQPPAHGFERRVGLRGAIAINMTQMCGIGPFITIPIIVAAVGGPQAVLGWIGTAVTGSDTSAS